MSNVLDRVKRVVAEQCNVPLEKVSPDSDFVEDLGCDSLDLVEVVMALEEEFEVEVEDGVADSITSVQAAVDYISNKI